jgi:CheY-like chemotaxis protein
LNKKDLLLALILLVDDDPNMLHLLNEIILFDHHQSILAEDGEKALLCCYQHLPDLIITDLLMPNKEGIEFIAEVKVLYPHVKIIAYSGGGVAHPDSYLAFAKGMGADRVFTKPMPIEQLRHAIFELLNEQTHSMSG